MVYVKCSVSSLSWLIGANLSRNPLILLAILANGNQHQYKPVSPCLFLAIGSQPQKKPVLSCPVSSLSWPKVAGLDTNLFVLVSILANGSPSRYQPVRPRLYPGQWEPVWIPTCSSSSLSWPMGDPVVIPTCSSSSLS
jgi:hypothetical protein